MGSLTYRRKRRAKEWGLLCQISGRYWKSEADIRLFEEGSYLAALGRCTHPRQVPTAGDILWNARSDWFLYLRDYLSILTNKAQAVLTLFMVINWNVLIQWLVLGELIWKGWLDIVLRCISDLDNFGSLTRPTLYAIESAGGFDNNVLYAILHEPIYCQGYVSFHTRCELSNGECRTASKWSAEKLLSNYPRFQHDSDQIFFTGEMVSRKAKERQVNMRSQGN